MKIILYFLTNVKLILSSLIFISIYFQPWSTIQAQDILPVFTDTVHEKSMFQITSMNHYGSNRFNNAFMDKFIFGGFIEQNLKDENFNRMKNVNVFGGEAEQKIDSYTPTVHPLKKDNYGMMISFSDNHLFSAGISKDFFALGMYGNAGYVGDSLDFSFTQVMYQHYQKFSIGLYDTKTLSHVQISYVAGSRAFNFHTDKSFLYTHADLDSVEFQLRGEGHSSASFFPYWAFQGNGFCADLQYNFLFSTKKGNEQIIMFRVSNIGAIFWNADADYYTVDSTTYYTGFNANDLIQRDSLNDVWNFEDTLGIIKTKQRYAEALPLELSIHKAPDIRGSTWQSIAGFKAILTQNYRPYLYAGVYYQPTNYFAMSTHLAYGGFSGLRLGMQLTFHKSDQFLIHIGTADFLGNILKNYGFGRSFNLSAQFNLK